MKSKFFIQNSKSKTAFLLSALLALQPLASTVSIADTNNHNKPDAVTSATNEDWKNKNTTPSALHPVTPVTPSTLVALSDGVYFANADMNKATDPEIKSMANNAINHKIKIVVKDGNYDVFVEFMGMDIGKQKGYLGSLKYFKEGFKYEGHLIKGETEKAKVIDYQTDAKGNFIIDSFNDKDNPYPKTLQFPLIPSVLKDNKQLVPLQVFVPVMDSISSGAGTQNVFMKIDWATLEKEENKNQADITFVAGQGGSLTGTQKYTVEKNKTYKQAGITIPTPKPQTGYTFDKWEPAIDIEKDIVKDSTTYKAIFKKQAVIVKPEAIKLEVGKTYDINAAFTKSNKSNLPHPTLAGTMEKIGKLKVKNSRLFEITVTVDKSYVQFDNKGKVIKPTRIINMNQTQYKTSYKVDNDKVHITFEAPRADMKGKEYTIYAVGGKYNNFMVEWNTIRNEGDPEVFAPSYDANKVYTIDVSANGENADKILTTKFKLMVLDDKVNPTIYIPFKKEVNTATFENAPLDLKDDKFRKIAVHNIKYNKDGNYKMTVDGEEVSIKINWNSAKEDDKIDVDMLQVGRTYELSANFEFSLDDPGKAASINNVKKNVWVTLQEDGSVKFKVKMELEKGYNYDDTYKKYPIPPGRKFTEKVGRFTLNHKGSNPQEIAPTREGEAYIFEFSFPSFERHYEMYVEIPNSNDYGNYSHVMIPFWKTLRDPNAKIPETNPLQNGKQYSVVSYMRHWQRPDHNSMADAFLIKPSQIKVDNNGVAKLIFTMKAKLDGVTMSTTSDFKVPLPVSTRDGYTFAVTLPKTYDKKGYLYTAANVVPMGGARQQLVFQIDWASLADNGANPDAGNSPNPVSNKVDINFVSSQGGDIQGTSKYTVEKNKTYKQAGITIPTPKPQTGYTFDKWEPAIDIEKDIVKDTVTYKAIFKKQTGQQDVLADGTYFVNADMYKTTKTEKSMSNNAIDHKVKIQVKDGKYTAFLGFKGMDLFGQKGYLGSLKYFKQGYKYESFNIKGDVQDAEVVDYQTDKDGKIIVDALNSADKPYPKTLKFPLIPSSVKDPVGFVPLQVFVPVMESISAGNGTQNVFMKIDWNTLKKEDNTPVTPVTPVTPKPVTPTPGGGGGGGNVIKPKDDKIDINNLKDGVYTVNIKMLKEHSNDLSMGNSSIGSTALLEVSSSRYKMQITTVPLHFLGQVSSLVYLEVEGKKAEPTGLEKYKVKTEKGEFEEERPNGFSFDLSGIKDTYDILVDPKVEIMGRQRARLSVDWSSIKRSTSTLKSTVTYVAPQTDLQPSDDTTKETNIKIELTDKDAVEQGTKMKAQIITPQNNKKEYESVKNTLENLEKSIKDNKLKIKDAIKDLKDGDKIKNVQEVKTDIEKFVVFEINLEKDGQVAKIKDGKTLLLKLPIPNDFDKNKLQLIRINDDGTLEVLNGKSSDGFYEVEVEHFSKYILTQAKLKSEEQAKKQEVSTTKTMNYKAYMSGYQDNTFKPSNQLTRAEAAHIISTLIKKDTDTVKSQDEFKDVKKSSWYYDSVNHLKSQNVISSSKDNKYNPTDKITRGQIATILVKAYNLQSKPENSKDFKDISNHWSKNAVQIMSSNDYITGYKDNTFKPDAPITRAEMVIILNKITNRPNKLDEIRVLNTNLTIPTDVKSTHWAYADIISAMNDLKKEETSKKQESKSSIQNKALDLNNLADGTYTVNIDMFKAVGKGTPSELSMSNNAVEHTADVIVKDKQATLHLTMKGMVLKGMSDKKGHLEKAWYYPNAQDYYTSLTDTKNTSLAKDVKVMTTYKDIAFDSNETKTYPQTIAFPVKVGEQFAYIKVEVDAMMAIGGVGRPDAAVKIDWKSLKAKN